MTDERPSEGAAHEASMTGQVKKSVPPTGDKDDGSRPEPML
jgi:hypothetical protein